MTAEESTDASFTPLPTTWETIDWTRTREGVRRLQMRIAKAIAADNVSLFGAVTSINLEFSTSKPEHSRSLTATSAPTFDF
jgi:hypothetical protein